MYDESDNLGNHIRAKFALLDFEARQELEDYECGELFASVNYEPAGLCESDKNEILAAIEEVMFDHGIID